MITITDPRTTPIRYTAKGRRVRYIVRRTVLGAAALVLGLMVLSVAVATYRSMTMTQPAAHTTAVESSSCAGVDLDNLSEDQEQSLLDDGWTGDKADHREELYPRGCVPGAPISTPLGSISCAGIDLNGLHADQVQSLKDAGWKGDPNDHAEYLYPGKCAPYPYN